MGASESESAAVALSAARFARATDRLLECAGFYREVVGLSQLFAFADHAEYSGFVFGLPDASAQLELVRLEDETPTRVPDPEDALVLYLREDESGVRKRLADHGVSEVVPDNPYWVALGAFAVLDPDGWMVIFVPPIAAEGPYLGNVRFEEFSGARAEIAWSFRLAEDSESALAGYLERGRVWVARDGNGTVVGHAQAAATGDGSVWEILNMAVAQPFRGSGIGRRLIEQVVDAAATAGVRRVEVATATADIGNLRFYQRCGFRMTRVVADVFTPEAGYRDGLEVDGVPLRDQVWFTRLL